MRTLRTLFLFIISGTLVQAQNLVPNYSFETNSGLPTAPGQYFRATDWNNVNLWPTFQFPYASPDYLHTSGSGAAQLPNSTFGFCTPFHGSAVMSSIAWHDSAANFREYFACQLTAPMVTGQDYDIVLNVRNASGGYGGWGSNGIQVAFSTAPLSQATHEPIVASPQIAIGYIFFSTSWQTLTFSFTPTQPFQYMTVGNFQNDATTQRSYSGSGGRTSYFFYDGISVTQVAMLNQGTITLQGETNGQVNILRWDDGEEGNGYELFRSRDGAQFLRFAETDRDDPITTTLRTYRDETPSYGPTWYKIRRKNLNGSVTWSNTVQLNNDRESELNLVAVYPNPIVVGASGEELHVQLEHPPLEEITAELNDMTGRKVLSRAFEVQGERLSTLSLGVGELASGVYSVRVLAGGEVLSRKVVVGR